jgi:Holliday junction resolvase RusA-like endonuclease
MAIEGLTKVQELNNIHSKPDMSITFESDKWKKKIAELFNSGMGYIIIWLFDRVHVLKIENGVITDPDNILKEVPDWLVRFRVFNNDKEWHVWRISDEKFGSRLRTDIEGESTLYVDSHLTLRSVVADELKKHGFSGNKLGILTRNYIDFENHQAGFVDYRFVQFV